MPYDVTIITVKPNTHLKALPGVEQWLKSHPRKGELIGCLTSEIGDLNKIFLLHHYGINRVDALDPNFDAAAAPRYIAVGASYMNGSTIPANFGRTVGLSDAERVNIFAEYRNRVPEAVFGNSVFLFRQNDR